MKKVVSFVVSTVPCGVAVSVTCGMSSLLARQLPNGPGPLREAEQKNMELVGTNDLQARSAYQPVVQHQGNRWILYVGHHALDKNPATGRPLPSLNPLTGKSEENGTSIVDVTDPQKPVYLHHLPVANGTGGGAQMVRVCDGNTLPVHDNKFYLLRSYANTAHEIWDVTNPSAPRPVRTVAAGNPVIGNLAGTHKSWWECDTGIAYIVGSRASDAASGWRRGNHIMIFDLGNPASPVFKRDWALDGQQPGGAIPPNFAAVPSIHGPISTGPAGNRVYFAYGTSSNGVMQIVDRSKLLSSDPTDFKTAEVGRWVMNPDNGAHTTFPIGKMAVADFAPNAQGKTREFVAVVSEETFIQCTGPRNLTTLVDVTNEARPQSVATFQVAASSSDSCGRGGRFGPHSTNENFGPPFYQKVMFVAYFNAGVRAVDIRDPYNPREVAHYVPETTEKTDYRCVKINNENVCQNAIQTNNVETDDRGYIFIVDRADTGLHVLRLSGDALKALEPRSN